VRFGIKKGEPPPIYPFGLNITGASGLEINGNRSSGKILRKEFFFMLL
jgi:hypothetical protein